MHQAGQYLLGEHDFSFRAAQCQSNTPWRNIHHLHVFRQANYIIDIQANAFVHHMVRNIVGSLLEIGSGKQPIEMDGLAFFNSKRPHFSRTNC